MERIQQLWVRNDIYTLVTRTEGTGDDSRALAFAAEAAAFRQPAYHLLGQGPFGE